MGWEMVVEKSLSPWMCMQNVVNEEEEEVFIFYFFLFKRPGGGEVLVYMDVQLESFK